MLRFFKFVFRVFLPHHPEARGFAFSDPSRHPLPVLRTIFFGDGDRGKDKGKGKGKANRSKDKGEGKANRSKDKGKGKKKPVIGAGPPPPPPNPTSP